MRKGAGRIARHRGSPQHHQARAELFVSKFLMELLWPPAKGWVGKMTLTLAIVISSHLANFRRAEFGDRASTRPPARGMGPCRGTFSYRVVQSAELFAETLALPPHLAATKRRAIARAREPILSVRRDLEYPDHHP